MVVVSMGRKTPAFVKRAAAEINRKLGSRLLYAQEIQEIERIIADEVWIAYRDLETAAQLVLDAPKDGPRRDGLLKHAIEMLQVGMKLLRENQ